MSSLTHSAARIPLLLLALTLPAATLASLGCSASRTAGSRESAVGASAPSWLNSGTWPDDEHLYAVGTVIFPERLPRRDAVRRASRQVQEQIARELEQRIPAVQAYLAELLAQQPEAEARLRAEAEAFARREHLDTAIEPSMWLTLRVREYWQLAVQGETVIVDVHETEEEDTIDPNATYLDGRTGEPIAPDAGQKRRQIFVLAGISRQRLREVFVRELAVYGIEQNEADIPAHLLEHEPPATAPSR